MAFLDETITTVTRRTWLAASNGFFTNPVQGVVGATITFKEVLREQINSEPVTEKPTGRTLRLSPSSQTDPIPFIGTDYKQIPIRDENGELIPGAFFTAEYAVFILESLFVEAKRQADANSEINTTA